MIMTESGEDGGEGVCGGSEDAVLKAAETVVYELLDISNDSRAVDGRGVAEGELKVEGFCCSVIDTTRRLFVLSTTLGEDSGRETTRALATFRPNPQVPSLREEITELGRKAGALSVRTVSVCTPRSIRVTADIAGVVVVVRNEEEKAEFGRDDFQSCHVASLLQLPATMSNRFHSMDTILGECFHADEFNCRYNETRCSFLPCRENREMIEPYRACRRSRRCFALNAKGSSNHFMW